MLPQNSNYNTHVQNKQKEAPEPMMQKIKFDFEPLLNMYANLQSIKQYYNNFLKRQFYKQSKKQFVPQFNLLDQHQKIRIISKVDFCISNLRDPNLFYIDRKKKEQLLSGYITLKDDLSIQLKIGVKQSTQSLQTRSRYQKCRKIIKETPFLSLIRALLFTTILMPQYKIFQEEWTLGKGLILGMGIGIFFSQVLQYAYLVYKKCRELSKQQQKRNENNEGGLIKVIGSKGLEPEGPKVQEGPIQSQKNLVSDDIGIIIEDI